MEVRDIWMYVYIFIYPFPVIVLFLFIPEERRPPPTPSRVYYKYPASEVDLIDTLAVLSHQSFVEMNITSLFCFFFHCGFIVPHLL